MLTERGEALDEAGPSTPVQVIGLSGVPSAGDAMHAVENERVAKQIVEHREDEQRKAPDGADARGSRSRSSSGAAPRTARRSSAS